MKQERQGWGAAWLAWITLFLVIEIPAGLNRIRNDTLSEFTWDIFSLRRKKPYWILRRAAFLGFVLPCFIGHLYFGAPVLWTVILPAVPYVGVILYWLAKEVPREGVLRKEHEPMPEPVKYSAKKGAKKAAQGVGELWLGVVTAVGLAMLVTGVDQLLPLIDEAHELRNLGVPAFLVSTGVFFVRFFINWWKVKRVEILGKKFLALIPFFFLLQGCAGLPAQPVAVVCQSCALVQALGVCGPQTEALTTPSCPLDQELYVTNYVEVLEKGALPELECRPAEE